MEESQCAECGAAIAEPSDGVRAPCPVCGSETRVFHNQVTERLALSDGHQMKGYKAGHKEFFIDQRSGPSYFRVGKEWHHLTRVIDRENDHYIEIIRLLKTGEVIKHEEGKLSDHTGHGGAKNQRDEP